MPLPMTLSMVDDSTWCARVGDGPTCYAADPQHAQSSAALAYKAQRWYLARLGRCPTPDELRELRAPLIDDELAIRWASDDPEC